MVGPIIQPTDTKTFKLGISLLDNPYVKSSSGVSFGDVLEDKAKEVTDKVKDEAIKTSEESPGTKNKKTDKNSKDELFDINKIVQNDKNQSVELKNTYKLLKQFKQNKKSYEEESSKGARHNTLANVYNAAGQAQIQPIYERGPQKRMSKSQLLDLWEKVAPWVTEDVMKKSIRVDLPLLNDVQALVLRMHPDRSVTASLLGSEEMGRLIKENKDKLDRNLKHHKLSLREFNTYHSELTFNSESGTKKQKKKSSPGAKKQVDLM
jgi:hypothetical protein